MTAPEIGPRNRGAFSAGTTNYEQDASSQARHLALAPRISPKEHRRGGNRQLHAKTTC